LVNVRLLNALFLSQVPHRTLASKFVDIRRIFLPMFGNKFKVVGYFTSFSLGYEIFHNLFGTLFHGRGQGHAMEQLPPG
jgi:hypothetical protein